MKSHGLFLLIYFCWGTSEGLSIVPCPTGETCAQGPAENFLQCAGLPFSDTGPQHLHRLRSVMEALMDLYTFMRGSTKGVPVLGLQGAVDLSLPEEALQNEALVHMWLEVKMKPLLQSVSRELLSCLSTKNFSCQTYQIMVQQLSDYFSHIDPVRRKWIYDFFMFPFLSRDDMAGCVTPQENLVDWLLKNFGNFRAMASVKDFSTLNMAFSGLEVLHLLTPEQKAYLLISPVTGLDNGTLHLVFHSMMEGPGPTTTAGPETGHNWTTEGHSYPQAPTYDPYYPPPARPTIKQVLDDFMKVVVPMKSLVHEFVAFTHQRNLSEIRSTSLAQFAINFTLSQVAQLYRPPETEQPLEGSSDGPLAFNVTSVEDWYMHVVVPVLRRFLPPELIKDNKVSAAFYSLFYLEHGMNDSKSELEDVCSLVLDQGQCGLTDVVQDVARVLNCAAQTHLALTPETVLELLGGLTHRLSSLLRALSSADLGELASDIRRIFSGSASPALTQDQLMDPVYIQTWFRVKLLPLLPDVPPELLSCLSRKNFSCVAYHSVVSDLSQHMHMMEASPSSGPSVYTHFIHPFLLHHNLSGARCAVNNSALWLQKNFGFFSRFTSIRDFYHLNPHFSGVEALSLLTPGQIAELLLLPLPTPPEKVQVMEHVFQVLLAPDQPANTSTRAHFLEVVKEVVALAQQVNVSCSVYRLLFPHLLLSVPAIGPEQEPVLWAHVEALISSAPPECVPGNITCPDTPFNRTYICGQQNGSDMWTFTDISVSAVCTFPLEKYACAQLQNFTAPHLAALLSCDLGGNSSHSTMLWKLLLSRLSSILEPALDLLAAMPAGSVGSSASQVLDVVGEIRLSQLSDQELSEPSVLRSWFSTRLAHFLPHSSARFLRCLSVRNISCSAFQHILQIFSLDFDEMTSQQQKVILNNYILRFLSTPLTGPRCVSMNSTEWLLQNMGHFSRLLPLRHLLQLNPQLQPLEVLQLLTPEQSAETLTMVLPEDKESILQALFDFYTAEADDRDLLIFLSELTLAVPQANLSCSAYVSLFNRLDLTTINASLETVTAIIRSKMALSPHVPHDCIIYEGECTVTVKNETEICAAVNSTSVQWLIDQRLTSGRLCDFTVEQVACASLSVLPSADLQDFLTCQRSHNSSGSRASWKLLLNKVPHALDQALDMLANMTLDPTQAALPLILDAVRELRLDTFSMDQVNHPLVIETWFQRRLRPFLSFVSMDFLHCLTTKPLDCSTYQHIVHTMSLQQPHMSPSMRMLVFTHFLQVFLSRNNTADPSCSTLSNSSATWLQSNLGSFSVLPSFHDLVTLKPDFNPMDALPQLSVRQLAEVSSTPGQLSSSSQVAMVMRHVPDDHLTDFFEDYSPALKAQQDQYPPAVRSAMLQTVFDRMNLSQASVPEPIFRHQLSLLCPLMYALDPAHVAPLFSMMSGRNCSTQRIGMECLNASISSLSSETQSDVYNHIILTLKGPVPLHCYGNDYNHSFYQFLEGTFMGFQFPNLTTFVSLMPHQQMSQLLNSIPGSDLGDYLQRPEVVDSEEVLCLIYDSYTDTPTFLYTESLPTDIQQVTLPCVWPRALSAASHSAADMWFDRSLRDLLRHLTKKLISPSFTFNSSCMAFQKLVSVMEQYNFTGRDFDQRDIFDNCREYLKSTSVPRCYNSSDPTLNSTAWFVDYMGTFITFITLENLQSFGPAEELKAFAVDLQNLALFNHSTVPQNVSDYYVELVYLQNDNFNPLLLPLLFRCVAPGPAFSQLTATESIIVLHNLTTLCDQLDPQVSAALAGNFKSLNSNILQTLGNECTGLSIGQIRNIPPKELMEALSTLRWVSGWERGQARLIITSMLSSGVMTLKDAAGLMQLGTLITGVPSSVITNIVGSELLSASKNPTFLQNMMSSSSAVQSTFIMKLIAVNSNSEAIVENVPDDMAGLIPRSRMVSINATVIAQINKKKWRPQQAELFFSVVAEESGTLALGGPNNLSSSVLQGFSCTSVSTFQKTHIRRLIRSCRRKNRVKLVESQLTCMSFYLSDASDATNFSQIPHDVLLYYNYSIVPQSSCRSYFMELGEADFSVFSTALSYKKTELFTNYKSCLGINGSSLTQEQVSVMGNMCCTLDASYIQDSHPSIVEKLQKCQSLTEEQSAAAYSLLKDGSTAYGAPSTWNLQTLKDLEWLPLTLPVGFFHNYDKKTLRGYIKYVRKLKRNVQLSRKELKSVERTIIESLRSRSKRSTDCSEGQITQVKISDEAFPLDYSDVQQFNSCLSAATVRDNLEAITSKVDDNDYLRVVLERLREVYPSSVPEDQVQALGPASRVATEQDISHWTITQLDTLSALMDKAEGAWESSLAKAVIDKYLSAHGTSLGSAELNAIKGDNLCALDPEVLKNISSQSFKDTEALSVSVCSKVKKQALFSVALRAFSNSSTTSSPTSRSSSSESVSSYQLLQPYLGGADETYVRNLVTSNVNMDLSTFTSLDPQVIQSLSVSDVRSLLGSNLNDLKSHENVTVVEDWTRAQLQSELDMLGIGLTGGRTTTATTAATGGTTAATGGTTAATGGTTAATGGTTAATGGTTAATGGTTAATGGTTAATGGTTAATGGTTAATGGTTAAPGGTTAAPGATTTAKPSGGVALSAPCGQCLVLLLLCSLYLLS
ncbi:unnamed protein product [Knipowitschia caucasica]|uniref:Uncharacterized protein n=1 Tax=Knipowitschia caucasica TaxID=637954 RepID=A0AAV2LKA2_KNICA